MPLPVHAVAHLFSSLLSALRGGLGPVRVTPVRLPVLILGDFPTLGCRGVAVSRLAVMSGVGLVSALLPAHLTGLPHHCGTGEDGRRGISKHGQGGRTRENCLPTCV